MLLSVYFFLSLTLFGEAASSRLLRSSPTLLQASRLAAGPLLGVLLWGNFIPQPVHAADLPRPARIEIFRRLDILEDTMFTKADASIADALLASSNIGEDLQSLAEVASLKKVKD